MSVVVSCVSIFTFECSIDSVCIPTILLQSMHTEPLGRVTTPAQIIFIDPDVHLVGTLMYTAKSAQGGAAQVKLERIHE